MSDETNGVVFVGGKAVEQHLDPGSALDGDERDAAKAAVKAAIEAAGKDAAEGAKEVLAKNTPKGAVREKDADTEPTEPKDDVSDEPLDLDKASVKQLLKAREKAAAIKREAKSEAAQVRQQISEQQAQIQSEWAKIQEAQRAIAQQQANWELLRKNPGDAVRRIGLDPEQFILDLAKEGTPEGAAERRYREMEAQLRQAQEWQRNQELQRQQWEESQRQAQIGQKRAGIIQEFTSKAMNAEKYPMISEFYANNHNGLVALGDLTAEEYRNLTDGKEAGLDDILDYIEDDLASKAHAWYKKYNGSSSTVTKVVAKNQQKPPAKAPSSKGKSLSPEQSGERRTLSSRELSGLDDDERHEAAKQAVAVALANSKD